MLYVRARMVTPASQYGSMYAPAAPKAMVQWPAQHANIRSVTTWWSLFTCAPMSMPGAHALPS